MVVSLKSGRGIKQSYDWHLIIYYLLLVLIGLVNIYASVHSSEPSSIFDWSVRSGKQCVWIITSLVLASMIICVLPSRLWEGGALLFYIGVILLLVAVIFLGIEVKGSRSWFEFGPVRFQPAEISKISTSLLLAFVMSKNNFRLSRMRNFWTVVAVILLPMMIILAESETGSALVYVGFIFMLYREGLSGWFLVLIGVAVLLFILTLTASAFTSVLVLIGIIMLCNALDSKKPLMNLLLFALIITALSFLPALFAEPETIVEGEEVVSGIEEASEPSRLPLYLLIGGGLAAVPALLLIGWRKRKRFLSLSAIAFVLGVALVFSTDFIFNNILQDHQRKRIEVLLGMKEDPSGVGYNVNQSMIAIGSGGLTGKGFLNGTQTTFGFVPEQSTDFIFCTIGEEWGFLGCAAVILLYVLLIARIINDAERSRESFTRIYGYCVAGCFFMHLFINIGMTIGLMPVIGIPLPLISYGGSSLWAFTVLLSIFIVLDHEERKYF